KYNYDENNYYYQMLRGALGHFITSKPNDNEDIMIPINDLIESLEIVKTYEYFIDDWCSIAKIAIKSREQISELRFALSNVTFNNKRPIEWACGYSIALSYPVEF